MAFNIDADLTEGVWVDFDTDVSFKVRYLMPEKAEDIRKACSKKKWRGGNMDERLDDAKHTRMLADYIIQGWKGVVAGDGSPVDCNAANKVKLLGKSIEISNFIFQTAGDIANFEQKKREMEGKNSESSSPLN